MTLYGSNISDEELMQKAINGDKLAFGVIYDRWHLKMFNYFRKMLWRNTELAEDFTQDLFIKIAEKPAAFNTNYSFSTWIFTLASNMCKNEYRKQSIRKHIDADTSGIAHTLTNEGEKNIENKIDENDFMRKLDQILEQLSEEHRQVFILRYKEELSLKEIAEITQSNEGTVKSRLFYAMKKISEQAKKFAKI